VKQPSGKGRRAWFWVGVILLSLSALFWLLLIPAIVKNPNLGGIILFIFLTALPIGIGVYGIRRGRKTPAAETQLGTEPAYPTQKAVQPIPRADNIDIYGGE